jgi:hypothetical protein
MRSVSGSQTMMNTGFKVTTSTSKSVNSSVAAKEPRWEAESTEMLDYGDSK